VGTKPRDFVEFYEAAKNDCFRAVLAVVGTREATEEQLAEAFARAWADWPRIGRHPAPEAWVVRTALNVGISNWRRRRLEGALSARETPRREESARVSDPVDPRLMKALRRLPERQREVIALRVFLGLDTAHTAKTLGIAPGTVSAHMARAVATLRKDLEAFDQEEVTT
jgi:RNA polymerase sigma factor (sigma-70 family)